MNSYRSAFANSIRDFIAYRKASGVWNETGYGSDLKRFDHFCADYYPKGTPFCQEMVDAWCAKRETELNRSRNTRIRVIIAFIKYLRERELTSVNEPTLLKPEPSTYVPHFFTEDELRKFFVECDNVPYGNSFASKIRHFVCPAFFRLLYSSGIRTTEARLLKCVDFDPIQGVLNIQKSKGADQHFVALHESMTDLLIRYDKAISILQPERIYFFESPKGTCYEKRWVSATFSMLWEKANGHNDNVTAYQLRHNYAITNINNWDRSDSFEFNDQLLYLSKSMGHRRIQSTLHYYSLVPRLADTILEKTENGFNTIVPEVHYEE